MKARKILYLVAATLAVLLLSFLAGYRFAAGRCEREPVTVARDTVTKIVSVYKNFPEPAKSAVSDYISVPRYIFLSDTVTVEKTAFLHDTAFVYLPREQKYYEEDEGRLRMWVSGYDPQLDRWELDRRTVEIKEIVKQRRSRWGIGVTAGYGLSFPGGNIVPAPCLAVGLTYTVWP